MCDDVMATFHLNTVGKALLEFLTMNLCPLSLSGHHSHVVTIFWITTITHNNTVYLLILVLCFSNNDDP